MSIFGFYFVTGLMQEAGWPRRKGLFNSTAVLDTIILDSAIDQMVDWAAALGSGRPALSLQIIAEIFRDKEWNTADRPNIKLYIENARIEQADWRNSNISPREVVRPSRFSAPNDHHRNALGIRKRGQNLTSSTMTVREFKGLRDIIENWFLEGLLWGFASPKAFEVWYHEQFEDRMRSLEFMQESGLSVESPPDLRQFVTDCEHLIRNYERDISSLPPIPEPLLADARALGRQV